MGCSRGFTPGQYERANGGDPCSVSQPLVYPPRTRDERAEYCVNPTDKLAHALGRKVIQHVRRQYRQAKQRTEQDARPALIDPTMSVRDPPACNDVPADDGTQPQERAEARKTM